MTDVVAAQVAVGTGGTSLIPAIGSGQQVTLANQDAAASVFLTAANGYELKAGKTWGPFGWPADAALIAYAATGTVRVDVLRVVFD